MGAISQEHAPPTAPSATPRWVRWAAVAAGLAYLVPGVWAQVHPSSFARVVAPFPPYNVHYLHDLGAYSCGIAVSVLTALIWSNALGSALAGAGATSVLHLASHVTDSHLGGHWYDLLTLGAVTLLVLAPLLRLAARRPPGRGE